MIDAPLRSDKWLELNFTDKCPCPGFAAQNRRCREGGIRAILSLSMGERWQGDRPLLLRHPEGAVHKLIRRKINLSAIEYRARPFQAFGRLREMGTLVPARLPLLGNIWLVTTYAAVDEVLKNDRLFCRDPRNAGRRNFWMFYLGLPGEDRAKFKKWFSSFANIKSAWGIAKVVPGLRKTMKYLQGQFEHVRQTPRPGLITALVEAEQAGDRLSDDELQSMVMLLLLAGHETTVHLVSNSILTVLQLPKVRRSLLDDWSRVDSAIEEMLRYNSPAQFAKPRFVTEDTEFYGQRLSRGEVVMPVLASANYDPARFDEPNEFVFDRPKNYHLGFGAGPHVCLGLKLARAETHVVLERLFTRWPNLQTAYDSANPDWSKRLGMRSLNTLMVKCL